MRLMTAASTAPMMLDVPKPLPLGMAARVLSSMPPPNILSIAGRVRARAGQGAACGEKPDRAKAALASPNWLVAER